MTDPRTLAQAQHLAAKLLAYKQKQDEIIGMAREAGFGPAVEWTEMQPPFLRFAALVAAKAAATEREACAQLAEQTVCDTHLPTGVKIYGTRAGKAIRARGGNV